MLRAKEKYWSTPKAPGITPVVLGSWFLNSVSTLLMLVREATGKAKQLGLQCLIKQGLDSLRDQLLSSPGESECHRRDLLCCTLSSVCVGACVCVGVCSVMPGALCSLSFTRLHRHKKKWRCLTDFGKEGNPNVVSFCVQVQLCVLWWALYPLSSTQCRLLGVCGKGHWKWVLFLES